MAGKKGCGGRPKSMNDAAFEKAAFKYIEHLSNAYPKQFFYYRDDEGNHCEHEYLERLIKEKEREDIAAKVCDAELAGLRYLYGLGRRMAEGGKDVINTSHRAWEIIMRNKGRKYGWDELPKDIAHDVVVKIKKIGFEEADQKE